MTQQNTPPAPDSYHRSHCRRTIVSFVAVFIALIIVSGGILFFYQEKQLQTVNQRLQGQLDLLASAQSGDKKKLVLSLSQQSKQLEEVDRMQASSERQLKALQEKVSAMGGADAKIWLLAQADFLVKMAGRKLWSDQDVTTAAVLLKSADASLADMNDPSLLEVRRAITEDINALAVISQIDFDGIILKVNQLSNQVDNLRLADNHSEDAPLDEGSSELSGTLSEWRQNLRKSWDNFMSDFISIRRRDSSAEPLLAPNQDIYLRENIRSRLLVAAQAVPRHQDEIYQQSLETISTWIRAYFAISDPNTKVFLAELDALSQQSITMEVPEQLTSQALLETLMQTRVRALLSSQPITDQQE